MSRWENQNAPDEKFIREVVRRVVAVAHPDRIILFGSAASGQMNKDSDVDLLVVCRVVEDDLDESVRIRRSLLGMGTPFDIFVMPVDLFETTKTIIGSLAFPAHKYGKVIYAAA